MEGNASPVGDWFNAHTPLFAEAQHPFAFTDIMKPEVKHDVNHSSNRPSEAPRKPAQHTSDSLAEAFRKEFGDGEVRPSDVRNDGSAVAKFVSQHFDEIKNAAHRRDGGFITGEGDLSDYLAPAPNKVSYEDLLELQKLADKRPGLRNYYDQQRVQWVIDDIRFDQQTTGTICGVLAGSMLGALIPLKTGGALSLAGAAIGGWIGHYLSAKYGAGEDYVKKSNYLSQEKSDYGDSLGRAYATNGGIAAMGLALAGAAATRFVNPQLGTIMEIGGVAGFLPAVLGGKIAGHKSATKELDRKAALGAQLEAEWEASR